MKKLTIFLFVLLAAVVTTQAQVEKPLPSIHVDGKWLVDTHGNHVVLHGVMDTPSIWFNGNRWGPGYNDEGLANCLTFFEKQFTAFEVANCNIFRLHLEPAWTNDPSSSYTYPGAAAQPEGTGGEADISHFNPTRLKTYMKSLYFKLAQKAMNHRQYVVMRPPGVCPHNLKVGDYYQKYLMEVWDIVTQNDSIRKYSGQISIELANEPVNIKNMNNESDPKALHDYFQPIVDLIRANGFKGIIWVPGTGYQSGYADYKTYPITGENIGYAVHVYSGWYGCDDGKVDRDGVAKSKTDFINQFKTQVPVVETNPILVSEVDWSPLREPLELDHYNEFDQPVYKNLGTWATASTSKWGVCYKAVLDHYGNISMTLTHPHDYLDIDKLVANPKNPVPAFNGNPEACSGACWEWYADYYVKDFPKPDFRSVPYSDNGAKYINPIVRADFPDPDVIRVGSTYYMVSTTMFLFPGATILKSQDLVNWEYCAQPLKKLLSNDKYNLKNGNNAYASGMWASSLKYYDGKFYLLINGNDDKAWLLTATNPEGEWTVKRLSRNYYDPGMLFDNGKVYIVCGINHLYIVEHDLKFNVKREKKVIEREGTGLEGCHFYKKGDYYYIYATYGGWPSGQVAFRSKTIFGDYEEKMIVEKSYDNVPNTIHQGSLVEDVAGKWWTVMQEDLGALGRFPNLQPVTWKNDWPVVGSNGKPYASFSAKITRPARSGDNSIKRLPTSDVFRDYPLGMQWEWNHNPVDTAWSVFERPSWLRLKTVGVVQDVYQARNMLTQRIFADQKRASTGTIRLDVSHLVEGDRAGITIFQDPYAMICVERTADGYQLLWKQDKVRDAGSSFVPAEKTLAIEPVDGIVYLRASIKYGDNKASFSYSLDNEKYKQLGSETSQSFNLSIFVGSRFGIFCYATKQQGGYADFDWFSTEASFDEAATYPEEFVAPDSTRYVATKLSTGQATYTTMVGRSQFPVMKAQYQNKKSANVATLTSFATDKKDIVDFDHGEMFGIGQGETTVTASYTDLFGNNFNTTFKAKSSYFPFDPQFICANVVGQGTYNQLSSGDASFKFAKDNQMGWNYVTPVDMSDYRYLVIKYRTKPTTDLYLAIYTAAGISGTSHTTDALPRDTVVIVDLQQAKNTSTSKKNQALNTKSVYMVTFRSGTANKTVKIKDMYLTNDLSDLGEVGVNDLVARPKSTRVTVANLSGQVLRRNVERDAALKGLPRGIYIVDGQKRIVR